MPACSGSRESPLVRNVGVELRPQAAVGLRAVSSQPSCLVGQPAVGLGAVARSTLALDEQVDLVVGEQPERRLVWPISDGSARTELRSSCGAPVLTKLRTRLARPARLRDVGEQRLSASRIRRRVVGLRASSRADRACPAGRASRRIEGDVEPDASVCAEGAASPCAMMREQQEHEQPRARAPIAAMPERAEQRARAR